MNLPRAIVCAALVFTFAGVGALAFQDAGAPEDSTEPQRQYQIEIDGQSYDLPLGEPTELRIGAKTHRVTLKVKPYVKFAYQGVAFEVPQQFSCQFDDSDPLLKMWDMTSGDASLLLQSYGDEVPAKMLEAILVPGIKAQFDGLEIGQEQATFNYGKGQALKGTRLSINLPDVQILQEIYVFEHRDMSFAIMLQDARAFNAGPSDEYTQLYERLQKSLALWD